MEPSGKLDLSQSSVLVVEDNKVNQLLVKNLLKKFGFQKVDAAENGSEALSMVDHTVYSIILMDIQLPDMDGYEITRRIRANQNLEIREIPVIALTGDSAEKEKAKARDAGMNDYVVKPYTPDELQKTIARHIMMKDAISKNGSLEVVPGMNLEFLVKFTGGDKALTIQLIEIFLQQVPDAVDRIGKLIPEKRWSEIFPIAHKVKSSFAIFELEEIKNCILAIEENSRDYIRLENMPKLFEQFKAGSEVAVMNLQHELKKLKA